MTDSIFGSPNITRIFITLLLWVGLFPIPLARAESSSIVNSTINDVRLLILPGERASISNSEICMGEDGITCVIAVSRDASLQITNSRIGNRVVIYGEEPGAGWLSLTNSENYGSIEPGLPADAISFRHKAVSLYSNASANTERRVVNEELEFFELEVAETEALTLANSVLCIKDGAKDCRLKFLSGSTFEATNSDLGRRVIMRFDDPYAVGLRLSNCHLLGYSDYTGSADLSKNQISRQDRELASDLRRRGLDAKAERRGVLINLPDVLFSFDKSDLTEEAQQILNSVVKGVDSNPGSSLAISGHTDWIGSEDYNQKLSEARATSVAAYLRSRGLSEIGPVRGYGKTRPVATNQTEEGRARNRRVEIVVAHKSDERTPTTSRRSPNQVIGGSIVETSEDKAMGHGGYRRGSQDSVDIRTGDSRIRVGKARSSRAGRSGDSGAPFDSDSVRISDESVVIDNHDANISIGPDGVYVETEDAEVDVGE